MRLRLLGSFLMCACSVDESGIAADGAALVDVAQLDAGDASVEADAAAADSAMDVAPDTGCTPDSCLGERCSANGCDYYDNCASMHAADPTRITGLHHFKGGNGNFDAFCDMATDSGGWTLAGRSYFLASASAAFGWFQSSNTDPTNMSTAYSLNAPAMGITFTQLLVGDVDVTSSSPNVWGSNINRIDLPPGFPGTHQVVAEQDTLTVITSLASCTTNTITMLDNVGFTAHSSLFYFRDNTSDGNYGLTPTGFALQYGLDCKDAFLDGFTGMIMVR